VSHSTYRYWKAVPSSNMSDIESSNERDSPRSYRIPGLKGFLPLSAEDAMSTRGQALPGLIQARTNSNTDKRSYRRRQSSFSDDNGRHSNDGRGRNSPDDLESGTWRRNSSFTPMWGGSDSEHVEDSRARLLMTPQMRSMRLIGYSNPRYRWEQYYKPEEELKSMKKPIRKYYERCNHLIQHYLYIDRLLDSSLPHELIQEYHHAQGVKDWYKGGAHAPDVPPTIAEADTEETTPAGSPPNESSATNGNQPTHRVIRTKDIYRVKPNDENTPLLSAESIQDEEDEPLETTKIMPPEFEPEEEADSQSRIVTIAIYLNLVANTVLLILKIVVVALSSSVSVLASLVDAALDFLSTAIVWVTTYLISRNDQYAYPIGRRRLEPVGILVFSVIMVTSFFQVALEGFQRLTGPDHAIVQLTVPAIAIMTATVVIKFACWLWCRFIPNSSVQALAQDAMTDVVFNIFSIIFPLVGYYAGIWWLDSLGGVLLSCYVIINWSQTSSEHIRNLTGAAATADERNILLYLTMRFAKTIKAIQGLQAYHSGDKLNVEVDIVLDEGTSLRDSHDLGESLQYVIESVPNVDRAFVHLDYAGWNLPSHMNQG
jgi:cation diffusion facilitator family transporter